MWRPYQRTRDTLCLPSDEYVGREMPHALNIYRTRTRASDSRVSRRARSRRKEGHQKQESTRMREKKKGYIGYLSLFFLRRCGVHLPSCTRGKGKTRSYPSVDARLSLPLSLSLPSSFVGVRWRKRAVETNERTRRGKTLPRRNRFVNLSWQGPLHPVPKVCALFTCLPNISFASHSRTSRATAGVPLARSKRSEWRERRDSRCVGNKRAKTYPESDSCSRPPFTRLRAFN